MWQYVLYVLAAAALAGLIFLIVVYGPKIKKSVTEKLNKNKFAADLLQDYDFKTTVFALLSFVITLAFATMNLVSAVHYSLMWYGDLAAYYFVLLFFRGGVLLANRKCVKKYSGNGEEYEKRKWRIYLAGGAFLIALEFAMVGAVTQMMLSERPAQSGEIMAISTAAYTFFKIAMAVYHLIRAKRSLNPVTQLLRNLNFADACMSIVSLTVLMISTFDTSGENTAMTQLKYIVGFAVCIAIIALAVFMIVNAAKKLKKFNGKKENER